MKDKYSMIIVFVGTLAVIGFVWSNMISDVGISRVLPYLIGMPIFIIVILLAVFGKDLFRKQQSKPGVEHE